MCFPTLLRVSLSVIYFQKPYICIHIRRFSPSPPPPPPPLLPPSLSLAVFLFPLSPVRPRIDLLAFLIASHAATHCYTLQHTATHTSLLRGCISPCTTRCKTLQYTAARTSHLRVCVSHCTTCCNTLQHTLRFCVLASHIATRIATHTAIYCNTYFALASLTAFAHVFVLFPAPLQICSGGLAHIRLAHIRSQLSTYVHTYTHKYKNT